MQIASSKTLAFSLILLVASLIVGCGTDASTSDQRVIAPPQPKQEPGQVNSSERGLIVDVAGAVQSPGVYKMPMGARVHEAIEAAGGLKKGAQVSTINRAASVVDGQQIIVPEKSRPSALGANAANGASTSSSSGLISINSADAAALEELPGIGPVTAERIVAERTNGGPFSSIDDLDRVAGIGPATIESLRQAASL